MRSGFNVNVYALDAILKRLDYKSSVLDLSGLNLKDENVELITSILQKNTHITELDLTGNQISPESFEKLIKICMRDNCNATELQCPSPPNEIWVQTGSQLFLQRLDRSNCFFNKLRDSTTRSSPILDLRKMDITDDDIKIICEGIICSRAYNSSLDKNLAAIDTIDLRENNLTQTSIEQFCNVLSKNIFHILYVAQSLDAYLLNVLDRIKLEIFSYLNSKDKASLSEVCQNLNTLFQPMLEELNIENKKNNFPMLSHFVKRKELLLKNINQSIKIRDLIVAEDGCHLHERPILSLDDLVNHIKLLGNIANIYHEAFNFENGQIKQDFKNNITRMVLNEFSLYPSDRPLSLLEFNKLLIEIDTLARTYHPNLVLVYSSLPVALAQLEYQNPDGDKLDYVLHAKQNNGVLNCVIHVQCGPSPVIDTCVKITPHQSEKAYPMHDNIYYSLRPKKHPLTTSSVPGNKAAITQLGLSDGSCAINYGGIIRCYTLGGAQFTTAIEICKDHEFSEGIKRLWHELKLLNKNNQQLFPNQISHVLTSNSIPIYKENLISSSITHADAQIPTEQPREVNIPQQILALKDDITQFKFNITNNYNTKFFQGRPGSAESFIIYPPFGKSLRIKICEEQSLDRLTDDFKKIVDTHNSKVINNPPSSFYSSNSSDLLTKGTNQNRL